MDTSQYLVIFFQILGSLALLIYGMKELKEILEK
jgi:phosphate:Na+ symporter